MPDVSICIVNWNGAGWLRNCLASIYGCDVRASYEVIVVDNASTDGSVAMVQREFPQVTLHTNNRNLGFAAGNNQAFQLAQGSYLLLLNNDTTVSPGTLDALVDFMARHPAAGMVGCKLLNPDGSLQPSCRESPTVNTMLFRALYLDKLFPRRRWVGAYYAHWDHDTVREVASIKGCCMLVRRQAADQVGPMDERFFMFWEEMDWCRRTNQQGWKVYFTPETQIVHYGGRSVSLQSAALSVIYYRSLVMYFRKHHGRVASAVVRLLAVVETTLRLLYWAFSSLIRRQTRSYALHKIGLYWPTWRWLVLGQATEPSRLQGEV